MTGTTSRLIADAYRVLPPEAVSIDGYEIDADSLTLHYVNGTIPATGDTSEAVAAEIVRYAVENDGPWWVRWRPLPSEPDNLARALAEQLASVVTLETGAAILHAGIERGIIRTRDCGAVVEMRDVPDYVLVDLADAAIRNLTITTESSNI